jgi:AraC-like DNA-binding protein
MPAIFFALVSVILYMLMNGEERQLYIGELLFRRQINELDSILIRSQKINVLASRIVFVLQVVYFLIRGQKLVKLYNHKIANFYSNLESKTIPWVSFFLYSFVATSLISIVFNFIGRGFFMESPVLLLIPSIIFSVLLFFIGFLGYMQNHTVVDLELEENESTNFDTKSSSINKLSENLLELFTVKEIYKNPELKITHLSEMLHTNRTYISKHINTEFSCTFSDFVNRYRVEEAKRLLSSDSSKIFSLNYISEKSGFGSMGSFMRVFRDSQGITPGQYRDQQLSKK